MVKLEVFDCSEMKPTALKTDDIEVKNTNLTGYEVVEIEFKSFFNASNDCPITSYKITKYKSEYDFVDPSGKYLSKDDSKVKIDTQFGDKKKFGMTAFNKRNAFVTINFVTNINITLPELSGGAAAAVLNNAPALKKALPEKIEVKVTRLADDSLEESNTFKYTSPVAVDPENNKIYFSFRGIESIKGASMKQKGNSFEL